jgi:hypothetical protein
MTFHLNNKSLDDVSISDIVRGDGDESSIWDCLHDFDEGVEGWYRAMVHTFEN